MVMGVLRKWPLPPGAAAIMRGPSVVGIGRCLL